VVEPLADLAADPFAPAAGDLAAVRFTGSSVADRALVAATKTPSVGLTSGALGMLNRKYRLCQMSASIIRVDIRRYRSGGCRRPL
jgi:hypothetical protein